MITHDLEKFSVTVFNDGIYKIVSYYEHQFIPQPASASLSLLL